MRTYVDSGVLITAARGIAVLSEPALDVLSDKSRSFVSSDWVKLEVLPKAKYFQRHAEVKFYDLFFDGVSIWAPFETHLLTMAMQEATEHGMSAVDAIHVVLAATSGCEELVTTENPSTAIHRTKLVRVISITS
jgi:predicted nucleic acid-binding protein